MQRKHGTATQALDAKVSETLASALDRAAQGLSPDRRADLNVLRAIAVDMDRRDRENEVIRRRLWPAA